MKISYKDIFNSSHKCWGNIGRVNNVAKHCGYKYFTWNGWIYGVDSGQIIIEGEMVGKIKEI